MKKFQARVWVVRSVFLVITIGFVFSGKGFSQTAISLVPELKKQKMILSHLDPADLVALWSQHLLKQLKNPTFTKGQRGVIKKALEFVTEARYGAKPATLLREQSDPNSKWAKFVKKAKANFSKEEADPVFFRLDPVIFGAYLSSRPALLQVNFVEGGSCNCLNSSDAICCNLACVDISGCLPARSCGWMGTQWCTGTCGVGSGY